MNCCPLCCEAASSTHPLNHARTESMADKQTIDSSAVGNKCINCSLAVFGAGHHQAA